MTREEFIESSKRAGIGWVKRAVEAFDRGEKEIYYVAQVPYAGYGGYRGGSVRCLIWTEESGWTTWFYNLSPHRAKVAVDARRRGRLEGVSDHIVRSYVTGGYNTRRGLFAKYKDKNLKEMIRMEQSHAGYLGRETGDSKLDHENRVWMRRVS